MQYRVVGESKLNFSHRIENGDVVANENYPAEELQPRDRTRSDMKAQLIRMGNNLNPADLLDLRNVNQGAPVIKNDGIVLKSNVHKFVYWLKNNRSELFQQLLERLGLRALLFWRGRKNKRICLQSDKESDVLNL